MPASIFDMSSTSLMIDSSSSPLAWMSLMYSSCRWIGYRAQQLVRDRLREADNGVERRAQLVAHIGQEVALGAVGQLGLHAGRGSIFASASLRSVMSE